MAVEFPTYALDTIERVVHCLPGYRRAHSRGLALQGHFRAAPEASAFTIAAHFQGAEIPCIVRLSNSSGNPCTPDRDSPQKGRVLGFAVRFELPNGKAATWAGINIPEFPARTPEEFIALTAAQEKGPSGKPNLLRLFWHIGRHLYILSGLKRIKALTPSSSMALETYFGIHTYFFVAADGTRRPFRYHWVPVQKPGSGDEPIPAGRDLYLLDEIRRRVARAPIAWDLFAQWPEPTDDLTDPSRAWPDSRPMALLGRLNLDRVHPDQKATELMVFDPTGVPSGIELSEDPVLKFRSVIYGVSFARREHEVRSAPAPEDMGQ